MLTLENARTAAERLVDDAVRAGADAADVLYAGNRSTSIHVRLGKLEDVSRSEAEEIGLRVFVGARSASVASSDLSAEALRELVSRAVAMAEQAPEDPFAGLAPADRLASAPFPNLDSTDPVEPDLADLRERALTAESVALGVAGVTNSSGGALRRHQADKMPRVRLDDRVGDVEWLCRRLFGDGLQLLGRSDRGGGRLDAARPCLA